MAMSRRKESDWQILLVLWCRSSESKNEIMGLGTEREQSDTARIISDEDKFKSDRAEIRWVEIPESKVS